MERITSARNPRISHAALLRKGRERRKQGRFLLEGFKLVEEALRSGTEIETLFCLEEPVQPLLADLPIVLVTREVLDRLTETVTPQGIAAVAKLPDAVPHQLRADGRYLLLENIQDAGNVGNMLRTAEAMGLTGLIFCGEFVDLYSPKVLRGSMGSSLRLSTARFETPTEVAKALASVKLPLLGAALRRGAVPVQQLQSDCGAVAIGNESRGLSEGLLRHCDKIVLIPMVGQTESLSAPSAAAILVWELWGRCDGVIGAAQRGP